MTEHTPTPWSYRRAKFPTDGEFDCGISAVIDGHPRCIAESFGRCATDTKIDSEANAAFIVKAVNSYEALLRRVTVLEMVIRQDLSPVDCSDDLNKTIVDDIHKRFSVPVGGSHK